MTQSTEPTYFDVIHDVETMACMWHDTMTGVLALQLGGVIFPDPGWDDFMVRTLTPWVNSARIVLAYRNRETFRFMDGPPEFTAIRKSNDSVEIVCYEDSGIRGNAPSAMVEARQFGEAICSAARKAENWARRNRCERACIQGLTDSISALHEELMILKKQGRG